MRRQTWLWLLVVMMFAWSMGASEGLAAGKRPRDRGRTDSSVPTAPNERRFVVVLQAGTESHEGLARALHAMLYSRELLENGYSVVLMFDGAGTGWAETLRQPDYKLHTLYLELGTMGVIEEVCDYCSSAFRVKENIKALDADTPFVNTYRGHPSLAEWVNRGYEIIVL